MRRTSAAFIFLVCMAAIFASLTVVAVAVFNPA